MKAIVWTKSGPPDVLELREVEKPTPRDNEILVKVRAATVTIGDVIIRKIPRLILLPIGLLFGFKAKKITGHEFSGDVETVGKDVKRFREGDAVFGTTTGLSYGANAEYVCVPEEWKLGVLALKPANMSYEHAASVPIGAMTALQILGKVKIKKGQKVLIYGASGSVGTYAVQLAKNHGAQVTGVCSGKNHELVRSIGADKVIDYTKEDFTQNGLTYDVIFDAVRKIKRSDCKQSLKESGIFLSARSPTSEKTEYLLILKELIESGKIKSVIDRCYRLEETAEAHRYVEKGHKKGNVVITL
ncbi:MAG: NAD(P)-dependent alcohol dehydrogenase [Planctomycetota bacterium]|jgi:NADPH:quinone reductase-like Zn-dependent oxidoreductase